MRLTTKPLGRKVRIGVIGLGRGSGHVGDALKTGFAEVVALCDIRKNRVDASAGRVRRSGGDPALYHGNENIWEKLVARDDIDVVYIATPWEWHAPMALAAMRHGKHAFIEVSAAVTVDECWELVDTSERTQRHCVILENCCYGENELFVRHMAESGVFGDITHGECAYIHDLRGVLFSLGGEGDWRREYHKKMNGNLYPTHGFGPVCQYMGIHHGDRLRQIVSMSSPELGLSKRLLDHKPNGGRHKGETYICGDMNTSLVKTAKGRTIMLQHDVVSPRPYSRINALSGTGATFFDYPARLALDQPRKYGVGTGSHGWLNAQELQKMRTQFMHPWIKELRAKSKGAGHGGMDYVMNHLLLDSIRNGTSPDINVYDAAAWSVILELSVASVGRDSAPVAIPDFTRGEWEKT
jgi:predicted dehydrogenase